MAFLDNLKGKKDADKNPAPPIAPPVATPTKPPPAPPAAEKPIPPPTAAPAAEKPTPPPNASTAASSVKAAPVKVLDHPLIQHKISLMRDKNTGSKEFRELTTEVVLLMTYEATRDLPLRKVEIQTPVAIAKTNVISGRKVALIPILRAGLGMVDGAVSLIPAAKIGHIGICRGAEKGKVDEYYCKLPFDIKEREVIVMDLMLASGSCANAAIAKVKKAGAVNIKLMTVISCPEGVKKIQENHPDVVIYTGALDEGLNDDLYIVPGFGDGGDRIFGTK
jgi:uracil phosphoribosyltransferase